MADGRGGVTAALMAQQPSGFSGTRGGPVSYSPYGPGFTSFGGGSAPQRPPQSAGFARPPAPMLGGGAASFAPPPSGFAPPPMPMQGAGNFQAPPPPTAPMAGGFTPPAQPTGIGTGGLFAPPPTPGAGMPSFAPQAPAAPPAFNSQFSPGALANPGGQAMRGRGF